MKLTTAISLLEMETKLPTSVDPHDLKQAQQLGIEAMKRERKHRQGLVLTKPELLPGETED